MKLVDETVHRGYEQSDEEFHKMKRLVLQLLCLNESCVYDVRLVLVLMQQQYR